MSGRCTYKTTITTNQITLTITSKDGVAKKIFPLIPITEKNLLALRIKLAKATVRKYTHPNERHCSLFVLKEGSKLFVAKVPHNFTAPGNETPTPHLCSTCEHCTAAPESRGGCQKIRDLEWSSLLSEYALEEAVFHSQRLEKYNVDGYEIIGNSTQYDVLHVSSCKRYEAFRARTVLQNKEVLTKRRSLLDFYEEAFPKRSYKGREFL